MSILTLYKNRGETPLACIQRFQKEHPEYQEVGPQGTLVRHDFAKSKMTYAGRLDPLAEGLLLVLVGEECKKKELYLGLDKVYEVDVLFGFATDTYDVLGKVTACHCEGTEAIQKYFNTETKSGLLRDARNDPQKILQSFVGRFTQKYPPFSSKTIKGKSLFSLFKKGELNDDKIPTKEVEIKSIEILGARTISKKDLETFIFDSINLVSGDFRQEEIIEIWKRELRHCEGSEAIQEFPIISLRVSCTSGTYMRSLAQMIGEKVGVPALAFSIKRIRVGEFNI